MCKWEARECDFAVLQVQVLISVYSLLGKGIFVFWQSYINIL